MPVSKDEAKNEIVPILEKIFADQKVGDDFIKNGVDGLRQNNINVTPAAEEFFKEVDLAAAEEAIKAVRQSGGTVPTSGPRALVIGFPVVAIVMKGAKKPSR